MIAPSAPGLAPQGPPAPCRAGCSVGRCWAVSVKPSFRTWVSRAGALACVRASARRPARSGRVLQEACPWTEGPPTRNGRGGVAGEELAGRRRGGRGRGVCAAVAGHRGGQRGRREPSPTSGQDAAGVKPRNRQAPAAGSQGAPCPARASAGRAGGSAAPAPAPPGDAGTPRGGRTRPPTLPLPDGRPPPSRTRSGGRKGVARGVPRPNAGSGIGLCPREPGMWR